MPKQNKRSKSSARDAKKKERKDKKEKPAPVNEDIVEETVETPVQTPVQKSSKKTKKAAVEPVAETVAETVVETVVETVAETETTEQSGKRQRRVVTKESVLEDFDLLLSELEQEIESLRDTNTKDTKTRKTKGVKFLKSVTKNIKTLRNDASRVMRTRKQSTRPKNTSSGFMKPVQISPEMAKFTGWEPDVPRSRVDVTKYLCKYIRDNDLQNPEDRRIIRPDSQLKTLLNIQDGSKDPLMYYSLQKYIQHHFKKPEESV
jgi:chromatin remodeling complex protein RSC6